MNDMNGYICLYKGKKVEVYATTSYNAQIEGAIKLKAKRPYEVTVMLAEIDGKQYVHSTASI